jgi:small subunit ribosomal protein S9
MAEDKKTIKKDTITTKGARKTANANVRLTKGKGIITINGKALNLYFPRPDLQEMVLKPLKLTGHDKDVDLSLKVKGSGQVSQAGACRHAISRALEILDPELRAVLKAEGFMTRDPRVKERKKPGLRRARRAPQWSKR